VINRPPKILVIKSDISELKKVENFLSDILNEFDLAQKYFNKIYLCVSEAVVNSIKHGNKNDHNKTVSIGITCDVNEINILIEDEGDGFDIKRIEDPTLKSNLRNESGRGIFIIKNMSDKLEYNEKGNRIQFKIECK
jgi:serine/threonine-protein kinase RsbW